MAETIDMGQTEAPENKEKVFLKPGYRKLTVTEFTYVKEEEGKTPLIVMKTTKKDGEDVIEFSENLYISGKLNKDGVMSSVIRLQELFKGLTGNPKMTIKPTIYTYNKKETDGKVNTFSIPNPKEICDYLNKTCKGKTAIFKVGAEDSDGKIFSKLVYSGFLYYTDKKGALCLYKEERDFTEEEEKRFIQKKKGADAPAHSNGLASATKLEEL